MITVGGLTRITGSGLSITEWDPIMGAIPPMSDAAWQDAFSKYQHIPQYIRQNSGMSLAEFKGIFWWEWAHRFLGRLLGVVFFAPFVWFAWVGAIKRAEWPRMLLLFALGGLQGFVGWWMVESGLETRVSVSQYRLAIHLGVALILLVAILWTALEYLRSPQSGRSHIAARWAGGGWAIRGRRSRLSADAARRTRCRPACGADLQHLAVDGWARISRRMRFAQTPWWINFFENPGTAQFDHRIGAYIVVASVIALWWTERSAKSEGLARRSGNALLHITLFQIVLGIATLLMQAPELLAALHQLTAALVLCTAVWHVFELRYIARA